MTDYILEHNKGTIIATYTKAGKLKNVKAKKGVVLKELVSTCIPENEKDIEPGRYLMKLEVIPDEFFRRAQAAWFEFYTYETGLDYLFGSKEGNALKSIGKKLTNLTGSSTAALDTFKYITRHWNQLDPFFRNSKDLVFINSQLNKILNLLKNGKQTGTATQRSDADDIRRRF
jgi:hypothetical protein